jgi:hypothetical protein
MCILGILLAIHGNLKGVEYFLFNLYVIYIFFIFKNCIYFFKEIRILFTLIYLFSLFWCL